MADLVTSLLLIAGSWWLYRLTAYIENLEWHSDAASREISDLQIRVSDLESDLRRHKRAA